MAGQRAVRDHGRRGRQPLVHGALPGSDRKDHAPGHDHGVPHSHAERPALGHHGAAGRRPLVHRGERRPGRRDRPASGDVDEYPSGQGQLPTFITTGPDGNVWFTEELGNNIVRLDPANPANQTEFPLITEGALPVGHQRRPRREPLVHRARRPPRRQDHARRNDHGIPGAGRVRHRRHRREPVREQPVVHRERLEQRRRDLGQRTWSARSSTPATIRSGSRPGPTGTCGTASGSATRSDAST